MASQRVHILTPGFTTPNGAAFLFPLLKFRKALEERGLELRLFDSDADLGTLCDCDTLLLDSKFYSDGWVPDTPGVLVRIAALAERAPKLIYADITDSSAFDHCRALPLVTIYLKNQLLRDRRRYLEPLTGYRPYTDYYHREHGVTDHDEARSEPLEDPARLAKLQVGWNSGLAGYGWLGPACTGLYRRTGWPGFLRLPGTWTPPNAARALEVSCRIGTGYARDAVAWQRREVAKRLAGRLRSDKLSRRRYLAELADSRVVVSPFGLGEITLRDFEIFIAGALALKPDMSHMETWPDLFVGGETIATFRWDLSDLEETIETLLTDAPRRLALATEAQERYRRHLTGPEAATLFCERFLAILRCGEAAR